MPGWFRVQGYDLAMAEDEPVKVITERELQELDRHIRRLERLLLGRYLGSRQEESSDEE